MHARTNTHTCTLAHTHTHTHTHTHHTHTHTHTHTHVVFYGLWGLSIGVMVFYTVQNCMCYCPTPKLSPHRRLCISTFPKKTNSVWFINVLNYGDTENVLINHLLLVIPVIPMSLYKCKSEYHQHSCDRQSGSFSLFDLVGAYTG